MSSSINYNSQKHAVITIEALEEESVFNQKGKEITANLSAAHRRYPSGPSAELQRQQRRRMMIHIIGWFIVVLMVVLAGLLVYYLLIGGKKT